MSKPSIYFVITLTILCFLASTVSTQTVQTPAPATQSSQPAPNLQDDVIRVSTELVQTGLTVVDKQGRFVDGLDRDKFELRINGKEQPVLLFERVQAGSNKELALLKSTGNRATPSRENEQPTSPPTGSMERGRTTFLFVDDMHLSGSSMERTRELLLNYVDNVMGPKDQAVIATASGQLGFLQQLTGDRSMLHLAIKRLTFRPFDAVDVMSSPVMTEYQAVAIENGDRRAFSYFLDKQCEQLEYIRSGTCARDTGLTNNAVYDGVARSGRDGAATVPLPADTQAAARARATSAANTARAIAEREVKSRARMIARQAAQVTLNTLSSLEAFIRTSSPIRERKLAIFISDGFFLNYLRSTNAYDLRRIADAALRSGMVIYTIGARGLVAESIDAATKNGFDPQGRATRLAMAEVTAAQDPLHALARDTGGRALINSNDLPSSLSTALQETSVYYLLAWRPETPEVAKDPFRRIEVSVKDRPDLTVRVQSGFFNEDPGARKGANPAAPASGLSVDDQLMGAIRATYPTPGIPMALSLGYLDNARDGLMLAASTQITPEAGSATQGGDLDVIGAVIDDGGNILSSLKQKVTIPADQTTNAKPMVVTLQFPKITPGLRQVRIAARDSRSGRIGSTTQWIEIPNLTQGDIALSSVFLSEGVSGSSQRPTIRPDARFTQTAKLRFQTYVYNAATSAASAKVMMQVELRRNGQVVTQTPPSAVPTEGVKDLSRIPVVGEFPLQILSPGEYQLSIVVTDQSTKKSASQQVTFIVQ